MSSGVEANYRDASKEDLLGEVVGRSVRRSADKDRTTALGHEVEG